MSLVQELESKVPKLTKEELAQFRDWFEQYIEDNLELRDEVKAELDQAWRDIAGGKYRVRQTPPA